MDDRGRVPFALLGVLLLVSSLTLAPSLSTRPPVGETTIERALDRAAAETQTAVRDGVSTASQRAAADPVVTPANTTAGRALNDSSPFRDSLRVRVYLQVRNRLERVGYDRDGVTAAASLPAVNNTSSLRAAKRRVEIERAGPNGTALRATVENVTLAVRRGGRVIERRPVSPTVVVATPVLALHEQVSTYQTRLNNGLGKPGFGQRLTARLYPMAWVRGYAQYGGVPISNVVGNRHVSLAANGALLGVQRSTFGRSDPAGRRALTEATAITGVKDIIGGSNPSVVTKKVLDQANYRPAASDIGRGTTNWSAPRPNDTMRIGINGTAGRAFRRVAGPSKLRATTAAAYRVEARLVTDTHRLSGGRPPMPSSPGGNWTLVDDRTTDTTTVRNASGTVSIPSGWHRFDGIARRVRVQYRRTAEWENGSATHTTVSRRNATYRVGVALIGRHTSQSAAPGNGISTAHDPSGSPLNGPNLADVERKATQRLVTDAGGFRTIVATAATGRLSTAPIEIQATRPTGLRSWVYRDLMALRERVRNVSARVERGKVGTFEANPPGRLLQRLDARRASLADVPATYNSTAQRARVAARITYLNAVEKRLTRQWRKRLKKRSLFASQLRKRAGGSIRDLRRGLTARQTPVPRARPVPEGIAGPVRTRVDARPPYLTRAKLREQQYPALNGTEHPLVAENINVFTLPYGNAASKLTDAILATKDRTRLSTAATALRATNATIDNHRNTTVAVNTTNGTNTTTVTFQPVNATLVSRRDRLQDEVHGVNQVLAIRMSQVVRKQTSARQLSSTAIVADGLGRWNTTHERAAALTDGRAVNHVGTVAARRLNLSRSERDWLRLRLSASLHRTLTSRYVGPRSKFVNASATATRSVAETAINTALTETGKYGAEQIAKKRLGTDMLPAGLPVAPPVTPWYATTNVWWVSVRGEYGRFAVTANHGPPSAPAGMTTYARDGDTVTVDVDDDGTTERLGTADRISFAAETGITVVVPPKPRGVGDKDGNTVERSPGWPNAGD